MTISEMFYGSCMLVVIGVFSSNLLTLIYIVGFKPISWPIWQVISPNTWDNL